MSGQPRRASRAELTVGGRRSRSVSAGAASLAAAAARAARAAATAVAKQPGATLDLNTRLLQQLGTSQGQILHLLQQLQGALQQVQQVQGAVTLAQRIAAARRCNSAATDEPFVVVPLADGSTPPAWPLGLGRVALRSLSAADASALLLAFALPDAGTVDAKRRRVAAFIGADY